MTDLRHLAALCIATMLPVPALAEDISDERIKSLVLEAIRENPEIVLEAIDILERERAAAQATSATEVLDRWRYALEADPNAPVLGNPDGDVTVVEFFDYNCPYCRRVKPEMEALLDADSNVRVVYREWPILGEGSIFAARAALASREQGKYEEFHWALMGMNGRAEEASVLRVAREVGLDIEQLREDMESDAVEAHIADSMELTQALGFNGTPSFVIGDALLPGFVEADALREAVETARGD
ncbi:DsbA family protein (plasmid) [Roseivivax marinus]|uniref:DsbA family protein n=1 Tax=Roseivivax marinus TaxID=1379903 RepID=UPI001F0495C7|nr:DsbA family protein [Roseivivax marinus]UMA66903.1 DsbA family protein [Roseivivax marinus]UMA67384.1 DsbA family protein [Roseivivax marinus]